MLMIGALESYKKGDISTDQLHAYVFTPATETTMAEMPCHKTIPELISENLYYEDDYNPDIRIRMADVAIAKAHYLLATLKELELEDPDNEYDGIYSNWWIPIDENEQSI